MTFGDNSIYERSASRFERDFAAWKECWGEKIGLDDPDELKAAYADAHGAGERSGEQIARDEARHESGL